MREQKSDVRNTFIKERKLAKDLEKRLHEAIQNFQPQFKVR
jgi:hypothetical protein